MPDAMIPPDSALVRSVEELFEDAAAWFSAKADKRFYWRNGAMGGLYEVFVGYPSDLSKWKSAKAVPDSPFVQIRRTSRLIRNLSGKATIDGAKCDVNCGQKDAYVALTEYWGTNHHAKVARVLSALEVYESSLSDYRRIENARRILERSSDRSAAVIDAATNLASNPLSPPPEQVRLLEDRGDRRGAMRWLGKSWKSCKTWNNLIHYLRLVEKEGGSVDGFDEFNRLRELLPGKPDDRIAAAERFFTGRVLAQIGEIQEARNRHTLNFPKEGLPNSLYQFKSQFEVAQLDFRVENFGPSKEQFERLHQFLQATPAAPAELRVDVLKFLATFECLQVVFDPPCNEVVLGDVAGGSASKGLSYADEAIQLARDAGYVDGQGWGYVVRAYAHECQGNFDEAETDYRKAATEHARPQAHGSSAVYTQFYHVGMLRRRGDTPAARKRLSRIEKHLAGRPRFSFEAELLTQRGLIAAAEDDTKAAANCHREAIRILAKDVRVRAMDNWGIVKRIRRACNQHFGCALEDLLGETGPPKRSGR